MQIKMIRTCFHLSYCTKMESAKDNQFKGDCGK